MANSLKARNDNLLNQWQDSCFESVWHFNQSAGAGAPFLTSPDKAQTVYIQPERDNIARYLQTAVNKIAGDLNYWPRPHWTSEVIPLSRAYPIQAQTHQTRYKKMIALGQRATTVIQAAAAVVYSSSGAMGTVDDVATITVNTTVSIDEIQVFYQVADFTGTAGYNIQAADPRIQIEPITLTANAGVVTIVASRALFVKPTEWLQPYQSVDPNMREVNTVDTVAAAGFVTAVDVYRVYNDTTDAIQLLSSDGTVQQSFTGEILNPELAVFRLGDLCNPGCWTKAPTRMNVRYYSGQALENGAMESEFAETIISFANAQMNERYTSFSRWTLERWERDQFPMVAGATEGNISLLTPNDAKNPYGLRRGEIRAWHMIVDNGIQPAGKLTRSTRWGW